MSIELPSVRVRLTLWHAGVLALIVCTFSAAILLFVRAGLYTELDARLDRELATVERVYREDPGELKDLASEWGIGLFRVQEGAGIRYQTEGWDRDGLARASVGSVPASWTAPDGRHYRLKARSGASYNVATAIDEAPLRYALWTLFLVLATGIPVAVALAVAGGYFLAGRALSPVRAMADKAREITAESLAERLPVDNPSDEFGQLAMVFNETLSRLQDAFERLRRFTADASHELRTPLTAMRSVGEVALQNPLEPGAYRDAIGSMLEEVDRLTRLVDSLLTLTRSESGRIALQRESVDLGELMGGIAEQLRVLAEEKQQKLCVKTGTPVKIACDPVILRLGLTNVLHNAIKYTPVGGEIGVTVNTASAGEAMIAVQDTGPGIAAAHRERIFERFYRVDAGRSRDVGGVGLGLAIARWAIEANGGRIALEGEEGKGSLFRVILPLGVEKHADA